MTTVAVIGAGVVGASVAWRLAQGGAKVWLVDRSQSGTGTTGSSFAWANANQKTPRDYYELNLAGLREHIRLEQELGATPWFHPGGNLMWEDPATELEQRVERLQNWGYAAEWLSAAEVKAKLEPGIAFPNPDERIAYFPDEGWVDAPLLATSLIDLARSQGAEVLFDNAVEAIHSEGGQVSAITTASGQRIPVDAVVNAAGPGADRVAALAGLPLPLAPTRGLLIRIAVDGTPLHRVFHSPVVNARPDGPGHLILHHGIDDAQIGDRTEINMQDPLCADLLRRGESVLPEIQGASIVRARIGIRPIPADGRSCVGAVSALPGYYEVVTHSGVTLGPLLGRLLAKEVLTGEIDPLIQPFRADRFKRA